MIEGWVTLVSARSDSAGAEQDAARSGSSPGRPGAEATIREVAAMLRARGERMTAPRRAVLRVLAVHADHLPADTIVGLVSEVDPGVHRATVYRTLEALSDLGVLQHVHVGHGGTAYHLVPEGSRHLHAQCRACGTVTDLPSGLLDEVAAVLARDHAFVLDAGHVALSGLCVGCRDARDAQEQEAGT